jgi:hypothetical protein
MGVTGNSTIERALKQDCAVVVSALAAVIVRSWHEADLRLAAPQGPLTVPLPTSGPECRFIAAFQTLCRRVLKVV